VENLWVSSRFKVITFNEIFPWQVYIRYVKAKSYLLLFIFGRQRLCRQISPAECPIALSEGIASPRGKCHCLAEVIIIRAFETLSLANTLFAYTQEKGVAIKKVSQKYYVDIRTKDLGLIR